MENIGTMSNDFNEVRRELEWQYQQRSDTDQTREAHILGKVDRLERNMVELYEAVNERGAAIERLQAKINVLEQGQRLRAAQRFGQSSEQLQYVASEALVAEPTVEEASKLPQQRGKKVKGKRAETLSLLKDAEAAHYGLTDEEMICDECGKMMAVIGKDRLLPKVVYVSDHYRKQPRYRLNISCPHCGKTPETTRIYHGHVPEDIMIGSIASPSLLAHIHYEKYVMCVPIDRQVRDMERGGLFIERDRVYYWTNTIAERHLESMTTRWHEDLQAQPMAMIDDSYIQVNKEPGRKPSTKSTITMMRTGKYALNQIILFFYYMTASRQNTMEVLGKFQGYLQSDGAAKFHNLPGIINAGCWQHVRHEFVDALKALSNAQRRTLPIAHGLRIIQKLFKLESDYAQNGLSAAERYVERLKLSKPLAAEFFEWCQTILGDKKLLVSNPKLEAAVNYAQNQRGIWKTYFSTGVLSCRTICRRACLSSSVWDVTTGRLRIRCSAQKPTSSCTQWS
ncbi:MAG: transposase [Oscillospiraceae bacterium]|jgi:transposase|nr:transposase [Oscillospiraceae bacterium]